MNSFIGKEMKEKKIEIFLKDIHYYYTIRDYILKLLFDNGNLINTNSLKNLIFYFFREVKKIKFLSVYKLFKENLILFKGISKFNDFYNNNIL
jgi:hypothetical protein